MSDERTTNQVISGATGDPVTTSIEAILKWPVSERVIVIEDCPELPLPTKPAT